MADVLPFFQGAAFDHDATQAMGEASDRACQSLHDNGQPDLVRQIIAKRIIEEARKGERDPNELCARALQASQHHESELRGLRHRFSPAFCVKLGEYRGDVKFGRVKRNTQPTSDRFV